MEEKQGFQPLPRNNELKIHQHFALSIYHTLRSKNRLDLKKQLVTWSILSAVTTFKMSDNSQLVTVTVISAICNFNGEGPK